MAMRSVRQFLGAAGLSLVLGMAWAPTAAQAQPAAAAAPSSVNAAVANVQAFYNHTSTFSADFTQSFLAKAYNTTKTSSGHVTFAKPGKMDWVYSSPAGNRVVSDGQNLRVYEAANKQMYQAKVNQSQYPAALSFLTGQGNLAQLFDFQLIPGDQLRFHGGYVLVGTPKKPTPAYTKVLFFVDTATSQVRSVLILDGQGNRNRFDFKSPKANVAVPASQFQFVPPPGTTIVHP